MFSVCALPLATHTPKRTISHGATRTSTRGLSSGGNGRCVRCSLPHPAVAMPDVLPDAGCLFDVRRRDGQARERQGGGSPSESRASAPGWPHNSHTLTPDGGGRMTLNTGRRVSPNCANAACAVPHCNALPSRGRRGQ